MHLVLIYSGQHFRSKVLNLGSETPKSFLERMSLASTLTIELENGSYLFVPTAVKLQSLMLLDHGIKSGV